ncbi:hypothetical protein [Pseudofrankia sp. BMG5.36]|uniref:hypothetical protein n=1 Tax=Pseudofrankia sp. BMG5.36 TaxID=1834512 RepID=UPI0008DA284A|nr:hypothetical protein BCD48_34725 [Pseudofrankia sp. BMG5.36]
MGGDVLAIDEGLARRLKALACTGPIHDLDARKSRLDFAEASVYAMAEIAFQILDQVAIAMDFDRGAGPEQVIARVRPFVAAQAPDRTTAEHEQVARWVLDNLINVGSVDRGFQVFYGTMADGRYRRLTFSFKLLVELVGADGEVYLRASDEAINVLIGALDTDVESAQIAAEIKLQNLINRGKLADAQAAALQARYTTIQYAEQLRRRLDATRRDVRSVDWEQEMPELIATALAHVEARYRQETAILATIRSVRNEAVEPERKRKAATVVEIVEIVEECMRRHTQLQTRLLDAGGLFRTEQDRQQFSGPPLRATVDLFGQLLAPTLDLPVADAEKPTGEFFRAGTGLRLPVVPRLLDMVELLLRPAPDRTDLGESLPEPELEPLPDPEVFTAEQWRWAEELLDVSEVPRRLSGLLADARAAEAELPRLVMLLALHAVSPEVGTARRQGDDRILIAVDDGTRLDDEGFGGADLLVGVARISGHDAAHADSGLASEGAA